MTEKKLTLSSPSSQDYEPYIYALANYLNQTLPPWIPQKKGQRQLANHRLGAVRWLVDKAVGTVVADDHF